METQNFKIVNAQSSVNWIGKKVTGAHDGTIGIKEGNFTFNNGKLTGGNVIIDTTSIIILDVTDPATNAQFAGHLASDDFFSIEKFPTASLEITKATEQTANNYLVEGNLTIKGITHPITFNLDLNISNTTLKAAGKIIIDRTKYEMKFRSGNFFTNLGDTLIYNEFELNVNVIAEIA
jgi:polyisoprenoid-binding protein YceI